MNNEVAKAKLPTKFGNFDIYVFNWESNVVVLKYGSIRKSPTPVLTRIHSECLTGDTFGSKKCDCGDQLQDTLKLIQENKNGLLIYLKQEGRGIGIFNKIKAYNLQEQGLDTVEANEALGLLPDYREYSQAAKVLEYFEVSKINLVTNNPEKIKELQKYGINIESQINLNPKVYNENKGYLETKNKKFKHTIKL